MTSCDNNDQPATPNPTLGHAEQHCTPDAPAQPGAADAIDSEPTPESPPDYGDIPAVPSDGSVPEMASGPEPVARPAPAFPPVIDCSAFRAFSVIATGGTHAKRGIPCQDAHLSEDCTFPMVSIAVVADGHGDENCFRSHNGSELIVACARDSVHKFVREHECRFDPDYPGGPISRDDLEAELRSQLIPHLIECWNEDVKDHYAKNPFTESELSKAPDKYREDFRKGLRISKAYGTTIILAAITPHYWFGIHVGDGRFTVLYPSGKGNQPVPWDPKCYLNVTTSVCDDDVISRKLGARSHLSLHSDAKPPVAAFVCTDGLDDNYPVEDNMLHLCRVYREIALSFAENFEDTYVQLRALADQFASRAKADDTSIAGFINVQKMKSVAPEWKKQIAGRAAKDATTVADEAAAAAKDAKIASKKADDALKASALAVEDADAELKRAHTAEARANADKKAAIDKVCASEKDLSVAKDALAAAIAQEAEFRSKSKLAESEAQTAQGNADIEANNRTTAERNLAISDDIAKKTRRVATDALAEAKKAYEDQQAKWIAAGPSKPRDFRDVLADFRAEIAQLTGIADPSIERRFCDVRRADQEAKDCEKRAKDARETATNYAQMADWAAEKAK
ncbi:MAG: protein phosphatase 2C domain-containing protein, partial [Polyangiaceae bacterium]|nr:protein phosphatase 2C domain-containing protein [Polyangiaceae bacterium]